MISPCHVHGELIFLAFSNNFGTMLTVYIRVLHGDRYNKRSFEKIRAIAKM